MLNDYISKCESNGTPFVNFTFHTPTLTRLVLQQINQINHLTEEKKIPSTSASEAAEADGTATKAFSSKQLAYGYGTNTSGNGKTLVIDFSSPNIAKPFHAGHLRSTIIGMTLANVYTANGWNVVKLNYLGDWGKQYGLLAVGFDRYGSEEALTADPIKHLYEVYVKINADAKKEIEDWVKAERKRKLAKAAETGEKVIIENDKKEMVELVEDMPNTRAEEDAGDQNSPIHSAARALFKGMEDGEQSALDIWKRFRDLSIKKYEEIYSRLNIEFDVYWGESQVKPKSMEDAVKKMEEMGLTKIDNGATISDLSKYKLGKVLVKRRDGTNLYITRDIGGAVEKFEKYKFDKVS